MFFFSLLVNLLLVAASCWAMYALTPGDNPYGYVAAAFSLVHGLLGMVRAFGEDSDECGRTFMVSAAIIEIIPLPMANIEFYLKSDQSAVALVHILSVIPLLYDLLGKMGDDFDGATETLKDLTMLLNIISTSYLAVQSGDPIYGAVAGVAFLSRYGAALIDRIIDGLGAYVATLGNAGIIALMTYSITGGGGE